MMETIIRPILFLDFDDVLCLNQPYKDYPHLGGFDVRHAVRDDIEAPEYADIFEGVFDSIAKVFLKKLDEEFAPWYVLSTSWRNVFSRDELDSILTKTGLDFVQQNLHETWCTPSFMSWQRREREVGFWLKNNSNWMDHYAVLDDECSAYGWPLEIFPNAVLCRENTGLTEEKYQELRSIFLRLRTPVPSLPASPKQMGRLIKLADYPVLAALAKERTTATKLDGRACRHIYVEAMSRINWAQVSEQEKVFMQALGINQIPPTAGKT